MLNDNLIFLHQVPSTREPCYYTTYHNNPTSMNTYDSDNDMEGMYYLDKVEQEEQDQYAQYEAAIQHHAFLKALEERKRQQQQEQQQQQQQKLLLQKCTRKYLMELERRRQYEEEQEQKRQYLIYQHLKHQQQNRLNQERVWNKRTEALELLKRREALKKLNHPIIHHPAMVALKQPINQRPDHRTLHRMMMNCNGKTEHVQRKSSNNPRPSIAVKERRQMPLFDYESTQLKGIPPNVGSLSDNDTTQPLMQNITYKDSYDINQANTPGTNVEVSQTRKNKVLQSQQPLKSSILIGDVEDASDSECEDEFNDYWHTRRPRAGKWIEPVDYFG